MSGIQTKQALKYVVMPGIIPRCKALFASGFGYIAFLMACIYNMVRLLPHGHPYLNAQNIGRFGIRHVIAEAANHLVISRKNIDQIVIFTLMLTGLVLLVLMLGAVAVNLLFSYALAGPPGAFSMFVTANPQTDIAYMLMDQVFGVPDFFGSCVSTGTACFPGQTPGAFPWPFHTALQELFRFYSLGILFIGFMIFLYFVVVVVVETATSGTPFGQRFKNMWVPVRLVVAIGLLIPLNYGYNAGQYITFTAAKWGSSFATNAWLLYNQTIEDNMGAGVANPTGESESLIAMPKPPDASILAQMMSMVHTCAFGYWFEAEQPPKTAGNMPDDAARITTYQSQNQVKPYLWKNTQEWMTSSSFVTDASSVRALNNGTSYEDALGFYGRGDIIIRFGRLIDTNGNNTADDGESVEATCGDVRVRVNDPRLAGDADVPAGAYLGAVEVQRYYYETILNLWYDTARNLDYIQFAGRSYLRAAGTKNSELTACDIGCGNPNLPSCTATAGTPPRPRCETDDIAADWKQNATDELQADLDAQLTTLWSNYNTNSEEAAMPDEILDYGWGGAGIWFNTLAQLNGAFATAFFDYPSYDSYPAVMEGVRESRNKSDSSVDAVKGADVNASDAQGVDPKADLPQSASVGIGLYRVHDYWNRDAANNVDTEKVSTAGTIETTMNMVFGTNGLFAMVSENAHIHPLAQLVALGKGLVESAIRNVTSSTVLAAIGGLGKTLEMSGGALAEAASGFIMTTAFIGLTAGLVLYYIVPFMPFVYFFFAVGSWLKTIFEAMVGVPLWALAHLRLDGEGLPGDAASNGYFLIFEIFVRPILSIFGLIAALVIFTAQVRILNFTWMIVTENAGGFSGDSAISIIGNLNLRRSVVDQFFFTIMYAVVVYMMATASFKLIDKIPDNILRWMGQGVSSFSDINQDPAEGLTRYGAMGGLTAGQQLTSAIQESAGGAGRAVGGALRGMTGK